MLFARHPLKPASRLAFQQNHLILGHIPGTLGTITRSEATQTLGIPAIGLIHFQNVHELLLPTPSTPGS